MPLIKCRECGEIISDKAVKCPRCGCPLGVPGNSGDHMLPIGTMLGDGRYRIEQHLANGGFGNTYIATDLTFNDHVAIKEFFMRGVTQRDDDDTVSVHFPENMPLYQEQLEKFKKEAMRLRRLNNPHIVRVQDLFEANGTAYYVMDYVKGESLAARMQRTGQPLSEAEAMHYFMQVLDALQAVHAEGLCHLDIKPANIMVDNEGNAVLIDFGASKQMAGGNATSMTNVAYTNGYAPIEQIEQDVAHFGPWTDIYALGATLYSLLNNSKPPMPSNIFADPTPYKQASLPFTANVSPATQQLILKMMTMRWNSRPQSINALRSLVAQPIASIGDETVLTRQNVYVTPQKHLNSTRQNRPIVEDGHQEKGFLSRNKWLVAAIAGALIVLVGLWLLLSKQPSSDTMADNTKNLIEAPDTDYPKTNADSPEPGTDDAPQEQESQPVEADAPTKKVALPEESHKSESPQSSPTTPVETSPKSPLPETEAPPTKSIPKTPGKKSMGYGTFEGTLRGGLPDDVNGRLTFTSPHLIDSRDPKKRMAEPGDYVIGEFSEGHLVQGIWYAADGTVKGSIIIGK